MFQSLTRYSQIIFYMFFVLSVDAMNFFLKYVLWVSAESDLCKARVAIWAFSAIVTTKEFYIFVDDPNCKRVGPFFWLSTYTLFIEYSIWFKFSRGLFDEPFPMYVIIINIVYFSLVIAGGIYAYSNGQYLNRKKAYNTIDPEVQIESTKAIIDSHKKK